MRISYWSSDVCSSDLVADRLDEAGVRLRVLVGAGGARQLAGREVDVVVALTRAVDAVGPVQPGVEPLRRVRRAHLACQHIAHLVVVGAGALLGIGLTALHAPLGPGAAPAGETLPGPSPPATALVTRAVRPGR